MQTPLIHQVPSDSISECFQKQVMEVDFPNRKIKMAEKHKKKIQGRLPTPEGDVSLAGNELVINLLVAVAQPLKHHSDFSSQSENNQAEGRPEGHKYDLLLTILLNTQGSAQINPI